jgi:hypothetical protein
MTRAGNKESSNTRGLRKRVYVANEKMFFTSRRGFALLAAPQGIRPATGLANDENVTVSVTPAWWVKSLFLRPCGWDALVVRSPFGRRGNQTFQLAHAVTICTRFSINRILAPGNSVLGPDQVTLDNGLTVTTTPSSVSWLSRRTLGSIPRGFVSAEAHLVGTFFHTAVFPEQVVTRTSRTASFALLRSAMPGPGHKEQFGDNHLVIHIRGEDAFGPNAHKSFAQPPFSFYRQVLDDHPLSEATIVSADRINPVLPLLEKELTKRNIPLFFQSGTIDEDIATLSSAKVVVAGRGTFIPAIVGMSDLVATVYTFVDSHLLRDDITVRVVTDVAGDYVEKTCRDNWTDSPEQRQMMLRYPQENLGWNSGHTGSEDGIDR